MPVHTVTPMVGLLFTLLLAETASSVVVIWDHPSLILRCMIGSFAASFAIVAWLGLIKPKPDADDPQENQVMNMAREVLVSAVAGMTIAPMVIRYLEWSVDGDAVMFVSAAVSFTFTTALRILWPMGLSAFKRYAKSKLPGDES